MNNEIVIKTIDYRPCYVRGEKALFHKWEEKAKPLAPSMSIFGDKGGQLWHTLGIVEFENGTVAEVEPNCITFADNLISQYAFKESNDVK